MLAIFCEVDPLGVNPGSAANPSASPKTLPATSLARAHNGIRTLFNGADTPAYRTTMPELMTRRIRLCSFSGGHGTKKPRFQLAELRDFGDNSSNVDSYPYS